MNNSEIRAQFNIPANATLTQKAETKRYYLWLFTNIVDGNRIVVKQTKDTKEFSVSREWVEVALPPPAKKPLKLRLPLTGRTELKQVNPDDPFYQWIKKPELYAPCWFTWRKGQLTIRNMKGRVIGHGLPPPSAAFCVSGWSSHEGSNYYDGWKSFRDNAAEWFGKMGFDVVSVFSPTVEKQFRLTLLSDPKAEVCYGIAHGGSYMATGAWDVPMVEQCLENRGPMKFAFLGHCGAMDNMGNKTLSHSFRKGQMLGTVTVGYSGMGTDDCSSAWSKAQPWQGKLFYYMSEGMPCGDAFEEAISDYPECADCMRFCGDEGLILKGGNGNMEKGITIYLEPIGSGQWKVVVTVKNQVNAIPIAGATVVLSEIGSMVTDLSGVCTFDSVPKGHYAVTASAEGYKSNSMEFDLA